MKLKLLDTFAGIGGFSYAAEKLVGGFETVGFIEKDPYCQQILKKNFPNIPIHDDITTYRAEPYSASVISAGFPCTDISVAGRQEGITETTRSGLFFQLVRTIRMVRPKYVILENVSAILNNGMDIVLGELFKAGYDAEWCCIPSSFVGACHQRDRWWAIAYPSKLRSRSESKIQTGGDTTSGSNRSGDATNTNNNGSSESTKSRSIKETDGGCEERSYFFIESKGGSKSKDSGNIQLSFTYTESIGHGGRNNQGCEIQERKLLSGEQKRREIWHQTQGCSDTSTNTEIEGLERQDKTRLQGERLRSNSSRCSGSTSNTESSNRDGDETEREHGRSRTQEIPRNRNSSQTSQTWRCTEHRLNPNWKQYVSQPTICRGDDGLSTKLDAKQRIQRLKMLGNTIVPQVAAIPLQRVIELEREQR